MSKVREELKYWSQIFLLPLYGLSCLMPRKKNIWVLGSTFGKHFADNPKYFFLYLSQQHADTVRAIWITKNDNILKLLQDDGLQAYHALSWKGIWYSLRAKVYLYDNYTKDINFWLSGGAIKINMWHGIPLKKINMDNKFDFVRNPVSNRMKLKYVLRRLSDEKPSHYVLTTSKFFEPIFSSAFATKKVLCCGYPRNDVLKNEDLTNILTEWEKEALERIEEWKEADNKAKLLLYMPTFRDGETEFFTTIKRETLDSVLKDNHIMLCIKPHSKSKMRREYEKLAGENIMVIDADADPYIFLKYSDGLITDYSSIYFDYLLLDKPIIFFCYDLKEYLSSSREMYFDYHEFTPGIKAYTGNELLNSLNNIDMLASDEEMRNKRKEIRLKAFDNGNDNACEILYGKIRNGILKG